MRYPRRFGLGRLIGRGGRGGGEAGKGDDVHRACDQDGAEEVGGEEVGGVAGGVVEEDGVGVEEEAAGVACACCCAGGLVG